MPEERGAGSCRRPDDVLIARRVGRDGRSRALVFGRSRTRAASSAGESLSVVSQHESRRLGAPAVQLALLDASRGEDAVGALRAPWPR